MTSVAVCPICDIAGCYHIREANEAIARAAMRLPEVPTDAQMHDACTSFRHDYDLLDDGAKRSVQHQCKIWWRCVSRASGLKPTPDVWPWDAIAHRFKYAARDQDGDLYLFTRKPELLRREWLLFHEDVSLPVVDDCQPALCFKVTIGTCDWKDSLVVRPGYVEAGTLNPVGAAQDAGRGTANASEGQQ